MLVAPFCRLGSWAELNGESNWAPGFISLCYWLQMCLGLAAMVKIQPMVDPSLSLLSTQPFPISVLQAGSTRDRLLLWLVSGSQHFPNFSLKFLVKIPVPWGLLSQSSEKLKGGHKCVFRTTLVLPRQSQFLPAFQSDNSNRVCISNLPYLHNELCAFLVGCNLEWLL